MKEIRLGTFYGQELIIKSDQDENWDKLYQNWIESERRQAVECYKHELFLEEMEKEHKKKDFWWYYRKSWKDLFRKP